jgi:cysteate synthase
MGLCTLVCLHCGREHAPLTLCCANGCDALLASRYGERRFAPGTTRGLFRFAEWLPCSAPAAASAAAEGGAGPVLHQCSRLGRRLGLDRLYCCFSGWWPEIGAWNPTCTFKDLEALPTLRALADAGRRRVVLASAGNTGRAFAHAADAAGIDVVIVVPEAMLDRLWLPDGHATRRVRLIGLAGSDDYSAAIGLANEIGRHFGIDAEGGARNVARRDGMGTVMLEAARALGRLPDHYVQAVGSGTGAIAAVEAAERLRGDSRFADQPLPRLHLSQNAPFLPIYRAWRDGAAIDPCACWEAAPGEAGVYAGVLANRNPPYALRGGLRDALTATGGEVYAVASDAARQAAAEFAACEGIDLDPAAAVAVASLAQAVAAGSIARGDLVLVNVTGGGRERLWRDLKVAPLPPDAVVGGAGGGRPALDALEALL